MRSSTPLTWISVASPAPSTSTNAPCRVTPSHRTGQQSPQSAGVMCVRPPTCPLAPQYVLGGDKAGTCTTPKMGLTLPAGTQVSKSGSE
jgi:hypothetical protein